MTSLRAKSGGRRKTEAGAHPLTHQNLIKICADPQLGFVVSAEKAGFDYLSHENDGAWRDWVLYDCRKVRSVPAT